MLLQMEVDQFTITNNPADVSEQCTTMDVNQDYQSDEQTGWIQNIHPGVVYLLYNLLFLKL